MKIFEKTSDSGFGARLNVVDENNVVVGFDYESQCYEDFGYYFTKDKPVDISESNAIDENSFSHDGYVFDKKYYEEINLENLSEDYDEGGAIVFKLTKGGEPDVYLVLFNHQNGYYSHGFDMISENVKIYDGDI